MGTRALGRWRGWVGGDWGTRDGGLGEIGGRGMGEMGGRGMGEIGGRGTGGWDGTMRNWWLLLGRALRRHVGLFFCGITPLPERR